MTKLESAFAKEFTKAELCRILAAVYCGRIGFAPPTGWAEKNFRRQKGLPELVLRVGESVENAEFRDKGQPLIERRCSGRKK